MWMPLGPLLSVCVLLLSRILVDAVTFHSARNSATVRSVTTTDCPGSTTPSDESDSAPAAVAVVPVSNPHPVRSMALDPRFVSSVYSPSPWAPATSPP